MRRPHGPVKNSFAETPSLKMQLYPLRFDIHVSKEYTKAKLFQETIFPIRK